MLCPLRHAPATMHCNAAPKCPIPYVWLDQISGVRQAKNRSSLEIFHAGSQLQRKFCQCTTVLWYKYSDHDGKLSAGEICWLETEHIYSRRCVDKLNSTANGRCLFQLAPRTSSTLVPVCVRLARPYILSMSAISIRIVLLNNNANDWWW